MKTTPIFAILLTLCALSLPACNKPMGQAHGEQTRTGELEGKAEHEAEHEGEPNHEGENEAEGEHKIVVTSPLVKDVNTTQPYVCQIHSRRHIEIRALAGGYLEDIPVQEGQVVKKGDLMFKILPILYQAKFDADVAEKNLAEIELVNTQKLFQQQVGGRSVVAQPEVAMAKAKLAKAQAKVELAQAELNFANVKAPFDGIVGQQEAQQGSLIEEKDILTTLSDNSVMWVYFNVPEARYLEYKAAMDREKTKTKAGEANVDVEENVEDLKIDLILANHKKFPQSGRINAIEADFNNETGNIAFRADFANPEGLLRHGQTGTVLINRLEKNATVIPQQATFEILDKRFVFVVGEDNVAHQHEIKIRNEMEDIYVIEGSIKGSDKIVLEGVRQVRDGDKVEFEYRAPEKVLGDLKYEAE